MPQELAEITLQESDSPFLQKDLFLEGPHIKAFKEIISQSPLRRVIIAVHPFFNERERLLSEKTDQTRRYIESRNYHLYQAAWAHQPVIVFEDKKKLANQKNSSKHYQSILEYPNVLFQPTIDADPTPSTVVITSFKKTFDKLFNGYSGYDDWTEENWREIDALLRQYGIDTMAIEPGNTESYPQYMYLRATVETIFDKAKMSVFAEVAEKLREMGVERIAIGGSRFHSLRTDGGTQDGCVTFAAAQLHRNGFPVRVSNYFAYPHSPTVQEKMHFKNPPVQQ